MPIPLILIVEDPLSEAVARRILEKADRSYEVVNVLRWNKDKIKRKIKNINHAARGFAYFVLTDQDTEDRCPPNAISELREPVHSNLLYRFAVMEIEAWVMAHREAVSSFLYVPINKIPDDVDDIKNPKEYLINLARKSRSSRIREDIPPRNKTTSKVGPDYNGMLIDFVTERWDIDVAAIYSRSLKRTIERLRLFSSVRDV